MFQFKNTWKFTFYAPITQLFLHMKQEISEKFIHSFNLILETRMVELANEITFK